MFIWACAVPLLACMADHVNTYMCMPSFTCHANNRLVNNQPMK